MTESNGLVDLVSCIDYISQVRNLYYQRTLDITTSSQTFPVNQYWPGIEGIILMKLRSSTKLMIHHVFIFYKWSSTNSVLRYLRTRLVIVNIILLAFPTHTHLCCLPVWLKQKSRQHPVILTNTIIACDITAPLYNVIIISDTVDRQNENN